MSKTTITEFEDQISEAKDLYFESLKRILALVKNKEVSPSEIREELTTLHNLANKYFNLFSRSISEFGLKSFQQDENIRNSKINDAVDISKTIVKYWTLLESLKKQYDIRIPEPSQRSYSTIQSFLNKFEPKEAKRIKEDFQKANLPIYGFLTPKPFVDMTKQQQIKYSIVTGGILVICLLVIAIVIDCPTNFQNNLFTTVLALSVSAFSAAIPGFININYRGIITASGAIAIFAIVFLFKPANISDFKTCNESITGNIFFGEVPIENATVEVMRTNQSTKTDQFGKFDLPVDFASFESIAKLRIVNSKIAADTIVTFEIGDLKKPLSITLNKYCVTCKRLNNDGSIDYRKSSCKASYQYISNFIEGFTDRARELGRTVKCIRE